MNSPAAAPGRWRRALLALASLRLTPYALGALAIAAVLVMKRDDHATPWLAAPLLALALNLIAAVATNGAFRRQMALLVFHLALIALVLLAAAGRLTYLNGTAEVLEGASFERFTTLDAGPLHNGHLEHLVFANEGFEIDYMPGPILDHIANRMRWRDGAGVERSGVVEDKFPLVLSGYHVYPTPNKGFAPTFEWTPDGGEPLLVALHLPSYPAQASGQARSFRPAGASAPIWVMLRTTEAIVLADRPSRFRLPSDQTLVVRVGEERFEIAPGAQLRVAGGTLAYQRLLTWMGYKVFYDWTIPWLLAACALAIASLSWHFWTRFGARAWDKETT